MIRHRMTLYIADRRVNDFMEGFGLRPPHKWFVRLKIVEFTTTAPVDESYFKNLIEQSKTSETFWIPVISYMGNIFSDPDVRVISDGVRELFIMQKA